MFSNKISLILYKTSTSDMKSAHKTVNNLINENIIPVNMLKAIELREDGWYLGIINLC